ncbi:MAG: iron ABC transporter permease [Zoogloea sp.]|nr:iron ABC transporter permease [Zoogloea sp.]
MRLLGPFLLLLLVFIASFAIGRYPVPPLTVLAVLGAKLMPLTPYWTPETEAVVLGIRLPRILAAMLVGCALSVSGAAYQGLFRNPMVSPGILGVSAGASLGAALAILLGFGMVGIQGMAFVFGLVAVGATWTIGAGLGKRGDPVLVMVLAGVIMGTLFSAFVSLVKFVADPNNTLPTITFWLMGSLASVNIGDTGIAALPILGGIAALYAMAWTLNVLCFGDEEARALGLETGRLRLVVILCATLVTAAAVAISGIIGLVGLIVPHLARMLVGPDHKILLPVSALLGGGFLLLVDDLARSLFEVEVPLGIVTSIIGAPFFLYLLTRSRRGWA